MEGTHLVQPAVAALVAAFVAARAYQRKSLDLSGALAGFLVMAVHIAAGYRYGAMLLVFFFSSSKLTKVGEEKKREVDADFKEGGQRNWIQVLSNSAVATVLVVVICTLTGWKDECLDSGKSALITSLIGGVIVSLLSGTHILFFSGRLGFIMADSGEAKQAEPGNLEETGEKQTSEQAFSGSHQEIRISGSGMVEEDDDEDSKTESSVLHNQKKPQRTCNKLYFSTGSSKSSVSAESTFDSDK